MLSKNKKPKAGLFVDASNIYFSEKKAGWKIDYKKLKTLIEREFDLKVARYYVAIPDKSKDNVAYLSKMKYLSKISDTLDIVTKTLKYIKESILIDGKKICRILKKGDVDVDIAVDVLDLQSELDVIIILSGDSDYLALRNSLLRKNKKVLFMAHKHNLSTELARGKYFTLNKLRNFIELGKKQSPAHNGEGILVPLLYTSKKKNQ